MSSQPAASPAAAPRRRRGLWLALAVLVVVAGAVALWPKAGPAGRSAAAAPGRPWNLILITFDTTRADRLGCYGYAPARTPALDLMAQNGLRYERCYAPATLTLPSHASVLTGLYPFYHGLRTNGVGPLDERFVTLAEVLRREGYATGAFVGAAVLEAQYGLAQGFDVYDDSFDPPPAQSKFEYAARTAAAVTDAAIAWLEQVRGSKYFLWVHYYDPHAPYSPPGYDPATAALTPYDAEIAYADGELNRLLGHAGAMRHATARDTLLVFAADHGEALWEHGEPTHGLFVYNECLRVPLIVHIPGTDAPRGVVHTPVSLVDVYPSILSWLGIAPPYRVHGQVLPLRPESGPAAVQPMRPLYFETYLSYFTYGWSPLQGVLIGNEKFISAPRPELYDLLADPGEQQNLYAAQDPRVARLRAALDGLLADSLGHPPAAEARPVQDEESIRRLTALGYAGAFPPAADDTGPLADPKDRVALHRNIIQAQAEIDISRFDTALEMVNTVVVADPDNPRALFLLADLLAEAAVADKAIGYVRARLEKPLQEPFDALLPMYLGLALGRRGELEAAQAAFEQSLAANPDNTEAHYGLAQVHTLRGAFDLAEAAFRRTYEIDPRNVRNGIALAQSWERSGRYADAAGLYEKLLAIDPQDWILHNNLAWALHRSGQRLEEAITHARTAVQAAPQDPRAQHTLGAVLVAAGQFQEAAGALREAIRIAPNYAAAHYQLALAQEGLGDTTAARAALARAVELAGDPTTEWLADAKRRLEALRGP